MSFGVFRKPLTVKRTTAGAYIGGFWVEGGAVTPAPVIRASVQPASQDDMMLLPEGRRVSGAYRLYTDDVLLLASGTQNADIVIIAGADYEAMADASWQNSVINHRSYLLARVVTP